MPASTDIECPAAHDPVFILCEHGNVDFGVDFVTLESSRFNGAFVPLGVTHRDLSFLTPADLPTFRCSVTKAEQIQMTISMCRALRPSVHAIDDDEGI